MLTLIGALLAAAVALGAVSTDQSDYRPGSVVTISGDNSNGAGYLAGETVDVNVSGPNGWTSSCQGTADKTGAWSCQVTLSDDPSIAVGSYSYTATGQTSGVSETGIFTDDQPAHIDFRASGLTAGTSVSVTNFDYTNPGGHTALGHTVTFAAPGIGDDAAADPGTFLVFTYPATIGSCTLTGVTPNAGTVGDPVPSGASGDHTIITGAYNCASLTADAHGNYSGNEGSAIPLTGSQTGGVGTITYHWDVDTNASLSGDTAGDAGIACTFSPSANVASPSVTCNDDSNGGHFTLTLTVKDDNHPSGVTDTAQLTVSNVKPSVTFGTGLDTSVNEDPTTTHHYTYTISDPGTNDTVTADSITPSCGSADGAAASNATNNSAGGSFDCLFPDGEVPANTSTLSVQATDDDGATSDAATLDVTVNNVNPTVAAFTPGGTGCSVSISSISFTDPGQAYDNNYTGSIDWGDSSTTSLGSTTYSTPSFTGPFTHTYSVGGSYTITASVTDEDTGVGTKAASFNNTPTVGWPNAPIVLGNGNTKSFNTGSAVPIKIKVTGCAAGLAPTVSITPVNGTIQSKGNSNTQDQMRYDASLPGFIYNWNTKGWAVATYTITVNMPPLGTFSVPNVALVK